MKKWLIMVTVLGVSVAGLMVVVLMNDTSASAVGTAALVIDAAEWMRGNTAAGVTLVEYSDFQCPACGAWEPLIQDVLRDYGNRIRFIYRHFPLSQHQNAELAARASEAAGLQEKFWDMHDMIFARQIRWAESRAAREFFLDMARELGLDTATFEADLDSGAVADAVRADFASGLEASVDSTPTFFLNGRKIQPKSSNELRSFIDAALNSYYPPRPRF